MSKKPEASKIFLDRIAAGDDERTEEAAVALGHLGDEALSPLRGLLDDTDPDRRWWAARALAAVGTLAAQELLLATLTDPDPAVRACAAHGIRPVEGEEATEEGDRRHPTVAGLVRCLADPSPFVSRIAADSLARFGPPAVPALVAALQEGEVPTRAGAARALSAIQSEDTIPALCAALDDPSAIVTYYAEEALERMGVGIVLVHP
jgi:HEAT repeat protein